MCWLYTARLAVESAREHMASIEEDGKVSIRRRSTAMVLPSPKAGAGGGGAPTLQRKNSVGFGGGTTPRNENGQPSQIGARDRLMLEVDTWALIVDSVSFLSELVSQRSHLTPVHNLFPSSLPHLLPSAFYISSAQNQTRHSRNRHAVQTPDDHQPHHRAQDG